VKKKVDGWKDWETNIYTPIVWISTELVNKQEHLPVTQNTETRNMKHSSCQQYWL